jgi:hypothetical protein
VAHLKRVGTMLGLFALILGGQAYSKDLSCEQCQQFDRERAQIQIEVAKKEREMEGAFRKKEFRTVSDLRTEINELRRKHLTLKAKEPECKKACRPDVVKGLECAKLISTLAEVDKEDVTSESELKKIDERYKDLEVCNRELRKLRELHRKDRDK